MSKALTFEEVDKHVQAANLSKIKPVRPMESRRDVAAPAPSQLCATYAVVRPIILLVSMLPIFPAKWGQALGLFIKALDVFCPQA